MIESVLGGSVVGPVGGIEDVLAADSAARSLAEEWMLTARPASAAGTFRQALRS
ncbi:hypothetical protein D3C83_217610 [compost metagenome]